MAAAITEAILKTIAGAPDVLALLSPDWLTPGASVCSTGRQLRLFAPVQTSTGVSVTGSLVGSDVDGTQLRLFESVQTSTGLSVVGATVVAGTQLRLLLPEQTSTGASVVVDTGVVVQTLHGRQESDVRLFVS
jgi:hypothetical protein